MAPPAEVRRYIIQRSRQLREEELSLKSLWNSTAPIGRLPPELLLEIFQTVKATFEHRIWNEWDDVAEPMSWTTLTGVCRAWRDVICSTPHLWKVVHIGNEREWVNLCIERSREVPLQIFVHVPEILPSVLEPLSNCAYRISKLVVLHATQETLTALWQLIQLSLPSLKELCIDANKVAADYICLGDMISEANLPSLDTVRLASAHVDWRSDAVQRLRVIHLRDWFPSDEHVLSLSDFLLALEACPNLEDLVMDFALPFDTYLGGGEYDVSGPVISLPRLRSLYVLCTPADDVASPQIFHLLSHLKLQESTIINIYSQVHDVPATGRGGYLDTIPQDIEKLPILRSATCADVGGFWFDCDQSVPLVRAGGDREKKTGKIGLALELLGHPANTWPYTHDQAILDLCALFGGSPLRTLNVHYTRYALESWKRLFSTFADLNTLVIEGEEIDVPLDDIFGGLFDGLVPAAATEDVPLPHLSTLHFKDVPWRQGTLQAIVDCVRGRTTRGIRLSTLRIEMTEREQTNEEVESAHQAFLTELSSLVQGSVVYVDAQPSDD